MKNRKPYQIILVTSTITVVFVWLLLFIFTFFDLDFSVLSVFFIGLAVGVLAFVINFISIEQFLHSQIKLIYRTIRKGKITKEDDFKINMKEDVLHHVAAETTDFFEQRNTEISKLKEQEIFRREFLGNLAHELKTPVFSIQGYILTLLEGGLEDESVNRLFLERASLAVDRMTNILDDLDEITKLEADRILLQMKKFDIVDLAKEVMESLDLLAQEKNINLTFSRKFDPIFVKADRGKIAQVLTNLIKNSISYGNENGETSIRFFAMEESILIEVADNGAGIEENELPRLFERFYRVEKSRNRHQGGSGLGLAIVKHIIESHGQTINVRSTVDIGSTFSFTLEKA